MSLQKLFLYFPKNIHDSTLPINLHSMAAKLILNIIDCLVGDKFTNERKSQIFSQILGTFVAKLDNLQFDIQQLVSTNQSDESSESSKKDLKFLCKTLISRLKSILLGYRSCITSTIIHPNSIFCVSGFSLQDRYLFHDLFRSCLKCFSIIAIPWDLTKHLADCKDLDLAGLTHPLPLNVLSQEDKELADLFSYSFTIVDVAIFHDVLAANMSLLVQSCRENLALLAIPQYFLAISGVSKHFCSILIHFLMENIQELGNKPFDEAQIFLRLFKLVFLSVTVYPEENESVLLPYLSEIITISLRHSLKTKHPLNYFLLLKSLFRSIGGGRYELLYKEVLPLLPLLLETLNSMLKNTTNKQLVELFVELCLTAPVRLSTLLPHLSWLMKPLLVALGSSNELVIQGLF